MDLTLESHVDLTDGFSLLVPVEWERLGSSVDEVRLVAVEALVDQAFRTNLVVTVDDLPDGLTLGAWQDGVDGLMPSMLESWELIDRWTRRRPGGDVVLSRLGHHTVGGSAPVTMRQVSLGYGGRGFTLTTSVWTPEYPDLLPVIEQIESSFRAGGGSE